MKPRTNFILLKAIRQKGLRQVDLVAQARLQSEARLSRILNGRVDPTEKEVSDISQVLGKSPDKLGFKRVTK